MSDDWQSSLSRWTSAGLIDGQTAGSIRAWEAERSDDGSPNRFAVIAFGLGGLLLVAGVLLFVASNWQQLSPFWRLVILSASIAGFHAAGALTSSSRPALATSLHAAGTGALGGGIFLSGQTFNLAENWPEGFLLWAVGAAVGLGLLRDWPHVLYTAILVPVWLWSKLILVGRLGQDAEILRPAASFGVLLAIVYLFAASSEQRSTWRVALSRLGAIGLIPAAVALAVSGVNFSEAGGTGGIGLLGIISWLLAILLPAGLAYALRRNDAAILAVALAVVLAVGGLDPGQDLQLLGILALYAAGSVGIVLWGLRDRYPLSVNVGVIGFALSVLVFYFASELFSKLGRSVGLIGAGLLFLGGGWLLERTRRTIIGKIEGATP